jgi:hypothetical protein
MFFSQERIYLAVNSADVNKVDPEIVKLPLEVL